MKGVDEAGKKLLGDAHGIMDSLKAKKQHIDDLVEVAKAISEV